MARSVTADPTFRWLRVVAIALSGVLLVPVLFGVCTALFAADVIELLTTHASAIRNGLLWPAIASLLATAVGAVMAVLVVSTVDRSRRNRFALAGAAPFFASTAARLFAWVLILGYSGVAATVGRRLGFLEPSVSLLSAPLSLVIVLASMYWPISFYLFTSYGSMVGADAEEAASGLVGPPVRRSLRLLRRRFGTAALASLAAVFIWSHSSLLVPSVLGGSSGWFVSTSVDRLLNASLRRDEALALANLDAVLVLGGLALIGLALKIFKRYAR